MSIAKMKRSETTEQISLFAWAERNKEIIPELGLMYHVPNEGKRTNGGLLKMAGMKSGVPDICLPVARKDFHGLYIEMKFGLNKPTKDQKAYMELLQQQGYKTAVAYGYEEAREIIRNYLAKAPDFDLVNCEEAPKVFDKCEGPTIQGDWPKWALPCYQCKQYRHFKQNLFERQGPIYGHGWSAPGITREEK